MHLTRLAAQRDKKLGKITKAEATQQAIEILAALQKLGDEVRLGRQALPSCVA